MIKSNLHMVCIVILLTCNVLSFANSEERSEQIDSLRNVVAFQPDQAEKVDNLLEISLLFYRDYLYDSSSLYLDRAIKLAEELDYSEGIIDAIYRQGLIFNRYGDFNSAKVKAQEVIDLGNSISDTLRLAKGYWLMGTIERETGNITESIEYFRKSLNTYKKYQDTTRMLSVYHSIGNVYVSISAYDSAAYYYDLTMRLCEATGNEKGLATVLNQLGKVHFYLPRPDYVLAAEYLHRSLSINRKYNRTHSMALNYSNLGSLFNNQDMLDSALHYYDLGVKLYREVNDYAGIANFYNNVAEVYEKQSRYSLALDNYYRALKYYREQDRYEGINISLLNIADIHSHLGNYQLAHIYYDSSLAMASEVNDGRLHLNTLFNKSDAYFDEGRFDRAYEYLERHYWLSDSIFNIEKAEMMADLRMKYEKEKDKAEILRLEKIGLQNEVDLKRKTSQRNIFLFTGLGIILFIIFLFLYFRQRAAKDKIIAQQRIRQLEEEKKVLAAKALVEGQDEERKRLASELHDGLGVILSTVKLQFSSIRDKSPESVPLVEKAAELIEQATGDVRKISHDMMPGLLTRMGLYEALIDLFDKVNDTEEIKVETNIPDDLERLDENKEIMLYRIIQELVNNTLKHAEAKNVEFSVARANGNLEVLYKDDGKGFDVKEKLESKTIGLKSIQSRINFMNGGVEIYSRPGEGTKYKFTIPIS